MNALLKKVSQYGVGMLVGLSAGQAFADMSAFVQVNTINVAGTVVTATFTPADTNNCPNGMTLVLDNHLAGESILSTMLVAKSTGRTVQFTYTPNTALQTCTVVGIDLD